MRMLYGVSAFLALFMFYLTLPVHGHSRNGDNDVTVTFRTKSESKQAKAAELNRLDNKIAVLEKLEDELAEMQPKRNFEPNSKTVFGRKLNGEGKTYIAYSRRVPRERVNVRKPKTRQQPRTRTTTRKAKTVPAVLVPAGQRIPCKGTAIKNALTKSKLLAMIRTVVRLDGKYTSGTYVFISDSGTHNPEACRFKVFASDNDRPSSLIDGLNAHHAEMRMIELCEPQEFWLTNSPCPLCARELMRMYDQKPKPTIHVAHFWTGRADAERKDYIKKCLAKMKKKGFNLVRWDWDEFNNRYLEDRQCKADVGRLLDDPKYPTADDKLRRVLDEVDNLSRNIAAVVNTWCQP